MELTLQRAEALRRALETGIDGEVRFDKVSRALYSTDASVFQMMPAAVVIPRTREDVVRTVRLCREHGVSITARGGGTSQAGQAIGTGVQLDFSKYLNRLLELNPDRMTVRVEPGIVLDELNGILKPYGLFLPLDLSTSDRATIGGMISNNSSGTRSVVYGKTLDYVEELTVLLSDGSLVEARAVSEPELTAKCEQTDLEGACYSVVRRLATEHADEIDARYPKILRRVGGYNLDEFTPGAGPFNLARLIVGSEGTLGLVLDATLKLAPLPKARTVCVVQFDDLLEALAATPVILEHAPSAVELVDRFILDTTRGKTVFAPLRDFIVGDPAAVLIVEFSGESARELPERVNRLIEDLNQRSLGNHVHRAEEPAAQARIWKLRRAALGLSMSQRGDAKAISFVEDTAVAPERLRDYIERFRTILAGHEIQAGFYAHASVGLLHIRPVVNMKTTAGVATFVTIAEKISDLVLEFGGALSGEHGDGLVRTPFQRKMFGPILYDAFCRVKTTFDPDRLFNPGKIVGAPPITENLRFGADYETRAIDTTFDFSDFGGLSRAAEQCSGVGACRKTLTGTMCPSYLATRDEADSTRGRANALRLAISGQLGPEGFSDRELYPVLDLCLECKACKSECPTGVDMARLKSEFLHQFHRRHGTPWRARLLANTERISCWGSRFAPMSNWIAENRVMRWLNEKLVGLDRRRVPPTFVRETFLDWWAKHRRLREDGTPAEPAVVLFADTFTNYYEPNHAVAAVLFAERLGHDVIVADRVCCGRPLISKGQLDGARRQAEAVTRTLIPLAERGLPIVFCEPGCYSAVRDDHPHLVRGDIKSQAQKVADACLTFEEWAGDVLGEQGTALSRSVPASELSTLNSRPSPLDSFSPNSFPSWSLGTRVSRLLLHAHCHQKALVGTDPAVRLLSMIPGCEVVDLDAGCCGMAGSFGYEREHYDVSRVIGERKLFPAVRERDAETIVVASGFSCRHQIEHFTGIQPVSPAVILERVLP